jgi:putative ABC transport system permease protein
VQKLKSVFSLLGVTIGVMFLVMVVSVVEGMDQYIRNDFANAIYGVNTVTVRRTPSVNINTTGETWREYRRRPRITNDDVDALRARLSHRARIGVESGTSGEVRGGSGRAVENVRISGASPEIFQIRTLNVERGRVFSQQEADRGVAVVILGKGTSDLLFEDTDPVGQMVRIRGFPYRVVGVLEEQGSLFGMSMDNRVIAPALSPVRSFTAPRGVVNEVIIQAASPEALREIMWEAEAVMRARRGLRPATPNNFEVETADESLSFWDNISRMLFLALPMLVAISLVVGGIVIMNIMLVSVMERTREIGVRKALGAKRKDILSQFLIESATLSGVGALIGVGIGVGLAWLVRLLTPLPAAVAVKWIVLGISLGLMVGIIAGVYPAWRASKLDPVDALRHE